MIVLTGQIFKFLYLPGAAILLSLGAILLVAVFIPVYYFTNVRKSEKIRIDFIFGLIGITFFIVFTFLLSLKNRYSTAVFENSYPSYEITADYFNKSNTALFPLVSSSELIHWMDEANQLYNQIEGLKIEITKHHFRVNTDDAKAILKNHSHFNNNELTTNFLLSDTNPEKPLLVLEKAIEKFQNNYLEFTDNLHTKDRTPLFDTDWTAPYESDQNVTWETYHFAQKPSIKSIQLLSLWQMNIRIMENEVLTASVKTQKSISYEQSNL